jgi:predicted PurR-regulated permease PerM
MEHQSDWRQPIRYFVVAGIFVGLIWFIVVASPLIWSLIIAALAAYILHPLVNLTVRRTSLSRSMAVNLVYIFFLSILIAIPIILTPFVIRQAGSITPDIDNIQQQIRLLTAQPLKFGELSIPLDNLVNNFGEVLTQTTTFIASNAVATLGGISTNLIWILVFLISIYYLLKDSPLLIKWILGLVPLPYQDHAQKLLDEIDDIWGNFLRGQLLLMLIVGILSWLGGVAVGLPGAFIIGIIAGVLDLIPSLGPTLAAVIAIAVAWLEGSTYLPVSKFFFGLIVLGIFLVIQQVENIWIRPVLMGRRLKLHPGLIFIGVFGSLALFGILTTLVIIPVMSSVGVIARYIHCRVRGIEPFPQAAKDNQLASPRPLDGHDSMAEVHETEVAENPPIVEKVGR